MPITGKDILFEVEDPASPGTFVVVQQGNSHTFTITNSTIETNHKDSGAYRDLFPEGSIKGYDVSMTYQYDALSGQVIVEDAAEIANSSTAAPTVLGRLYFAGNGSGATYREGTFQVSSYEIVGEVEGAPVVTAQMISTGQVTKGTLPP